MKLSASPSVILFLPDFLLGFIWQPVLRPNIWYIKHHLVATVNVIIAIGIDRIGVSEIPA